MSSGPFLTVVRKEVVDNVRDRRTLAAALLYPLLGPGMIFLIIYTLGSSAAQLEHNLEVPIVGPTERAGPGVVHAAAWGSSSRSRPPILREPSWTEMWTRS